MPMHMTPTRAPRMVAPLRRSLREVCPIRHPRALSDTLVVPSVRTDWNTISAELGSQATHLTSMRTMLERGTSVMRCHISRTSSHTFGGTPASHTTGIGPN